MSQKIKLLGEKLPKSPYGTDYFWFDSLSGTEKINELFEYHLIVKVRNEYYQPAHGYRGLEGYASKQSAAIGGTPGSNFNLQQLIGTEISTQVPLDGLKLEQVLSGSRFYRGLVNRVELLPVKNRHATYKITLVPWLWLLTKTTNYKIFQNKTVLRIIEEVLTAYPYPVDYRCSVEYDTLDFQVQYGETDFHFIHRLMQEHGINFYFEHSQEHLTLVLSDNNAAHKKMDLKGYQTLSIYPPNQRFPNNAEYIESFEPAQQLVSGKIQLSDYQFKQPSLVQTAQDQFIWDHQHAEHEIYEWQQGDFKLEQDGTIKAKQRIEGLYQHGYRATGYGHLKGLQTGFRFELENHPNIDANRSWLVLGTQTTIQDISEEKSDHQFYDGQVKFLVQPDDQILRPDLTLKKPHGRPQTAIVVGAEGQEIYTDQYGRIKVKFHWNRPTPAQWEDTPSDTNTCWLRVSTAWAGHQFGTIHLPRVGQEVIVDFFNGDPDMPFVAGRLNNPEQMPVWELPSQQALSGIKSKELGGNQSNQLVMDDTQGQVQVQLKSDHQASELNLGYITRIPDNNGRKDFRGEGFELRTDGHGVIRSAKGLVLTTYAKNQAQSYAKNISELTGKLKQAVEQQKRQTKVAINQKAEERDISATPQTDLLTQQQTIASNGEEQSELTNPHIAMGTTAGIAMVAQESIHLNSNQHIALTSGQDVSFATQERFFTSAGAGIRMFTQDEGMRFFAGKGNVELQAQSGTLEAIARQQIKVISTEDKIELTSPKELVLTGGGSQIKINANGVLITTSANLTVKAAQHSFEGGNQIHPDLPALPKTDIKPQDLLLEYLHGDETPAQGTKYTVKFADGSEKTGFLDEKGQALIKNAPKGKAKVFYEMEFKKSEQPSVVDDSWFSQFFSQKSK